MLQNNLLPTACLICGPRALSKEIFPVTFIPELVSGFDFSARKHHKKIHYRVVQCNSCGLVRSDPVFSDEVVNQFYQESGFEYSHETKNLARTYFYYFQKLLGIVPKDSRILEVGCGNGFFLSHLWNQGYRNIVGFDPSLEARAQAPKEIRHCILARPFSVQEHQISMFDVICSFHTIDHLSRPDSFLEVCRKLLRSGGWMYHVTHNVASPLHRLAGEHSVAYDIQHFYMFSLETIQKLFTRVGFSRVIAVPISNRFSLAHLAHMSPLPIFFKNVLSHIHLSITLPVGNMAVVARV